MESFCEYLKAWNKKDRITVAFSNETEERTIYFQWDGNRVTGIICDGCWYSFNQTDYAVFYRPIINSGYVHKIEFNVTFRIFGWVSKNTTEWNFDDWEKESFIEET